MPTQQKRDQVQDIKDRLERSTIVMTASYSGISVNEMTELRRAMRGGGVDFTVVKNTLLALAAEEAQKPQLKEIVKGPTAVAFGYDDPASAAKVIADYIRTGRSSLAVMGAVLGDGTQLSSDEVNKLALLPPRDQLLAMLLGQMQAPIAQLLTIMNAPLQALDNVLQARVRQMEEEGPAPASDSSPEPEPPTSDTSTETEANGETEDAPAAEASTDEAPADDHPLAEAEEASETEDVPAAEASTDEAPADEQPIAEAEEPSETEPEPAAEEASPEEPSTEEPEAGTEPEPEAESDEDPKSD